MTREFAQRVQAKAEELYALAKKANAMPDAYESAARVFMRAAVEWRLAAEQGHPAEQDDMNQKSAQCDYQAAAACDAAGHLTYGPGTLPDPTIERSHG